MTPLPLSRANLPALAARATTPRYDPAALRPGIVHLGLTDAHRAHMARYTHDLMQANPDDLQWGILAATDTKLHDALTAQDSLYTLVERDAEAQAITIVASLAGTIFAAHSTADLLQATENPAIRIISLTVTERGYCLDPHTRHLDPNHPLIQRDLATPNAPASAIGILVEALRRRLHARQSAPTLLSCDDIPHNGTVLRDAVLTLATMQDQSLARWIESEVSFPSTLSDRLTAPADPAWLRDTIGIEDAAPVFTETYTSWVLEDRFPRGRPAWQDVGARFVSDIAPHQLMKLHLQDASHLTISTLARLLGHPTLAHAMADPLIPRMLTALMDRETAPTLPDIPGIDLPAHKAELIRRLTNPSTPDTQIPLEALLSPIRARLAAKAPLDILAFALAAWLRHLSGQDERGRPIPIHHPQADLLQARTRAAGPDPVPLLSIGPIFGPAGTDPALIAPVARCLASLYQNGTLATLQAEAARLSF